jgi:hypothetical protein
MAKKRGTDKTMEVLIPSRSHGLQRMSVESLQTIPEEEMWLASRKSARTRRAYQADVAHFMHTFGISSPEELRSVNHRAVMAWERIMREDEGKQATTVRRRLAAQHLLDMLTGVDGVHLATLKVRFESPQGIFLGLAVNASIINDAHHKN